jgi:hypothetical protein
MGYGLLADEDDHGLIDPLPKGEWQSKVTEAVLTNFARTACVSEHRQNPLPSRSPAIVPGFILWLGLPASRSSRRDQCHHDDERQ